MITENKKQGFESPSGSEFYTPDLLGEALGVGEIYDKIGRKIEVGDVLKVFHFIGARRKRHYMYKFVLARMNWKKSNKDFLHVSHLDRNNPNKCYYYRIDGQQLEDVEIVQGYGPDGMSYEDRPKLYTPKTVSDEITTSRARK